MHAVRWLASPRQGNADPYKKKPSAISRQKIYINTSSVSLWLTPSPTGEGWRKSLLSSAHGLHPRCPVSATPTHMLRICVNPRHTFICGRADNACTNLLGFLVRYVRTRGIVEDVESAKIHTFVLLFAARTRHALLLAANSCTPPVVWKEDGASPPC